MVAHEETMADSPAVEDAFHAAIHQVDELVKQFEAHPSPEIREQVMDLLQAIDALHRIGLTHLAHRLAELGHPDWIEAAAGDPVVRTLLVLYDLLPVDPMLQAEAAIEDLRSYIQSHGGDVEILEVAEGIITLRLSGACLECPAANSTLQNGIQEAFRKKFPGFSGIRVSPPEPVMQSV